jgi:hypothetical protein
MFWGKHIRRPPLISGKEGKEGRKKGRIGMEITRFVAAACAMENIKQEI